MQSVRLLHTSSLCGLQAAATLHILLDQFLLRSDAKLDIMGDASFPLLFIVSGFVVLAWCKTVTAPYVYTLQWAYAFWKKNFVRIAPLYYLSNLVVVPLYVGMQASVDYTGVVLSVFFLQCWTINPALNGVSWIVSTFVFLYLVTPFILKKIVCVDMLHTYTCIVFLLALQGILYGGVFWYGSTFTPQLHSLARSWPLVRLPVYMSGIIIGDKCYRCFEIEAKNPSRRRYGLLADICITLYIAVTLTVACLTSVYVVPTDSVYGVSYVSVIRAGMEMASPFIFIPIIYTLVLDETVGFHGTSRQTESIYGAFFRSRVMQNIGSASSAMYMLQCVPPGSISLLLRLDWIGYPGVPVGSQLPLWSTIVSFILSIAVGFLTDRYVLHGTKWWLLTRLVVLPAEQPTSLPKPLDDVYTVSCISITQADITLPPSKLSKVVCTPDMYVVNKDRRHPLFHTALMESVIAENYIAVSRMRV
jgi:hypothetical protein